GREAGLGYRSGTEIDARVPGRREQNDDRVRRCARWRERTARILVRPEGALRMPRRVDSPPGPTMPQVTRAWMWGCQFVKSLRDRFPSCAVPATAAAAGGGSHLEPLPLPLGPPHHFSKPCVTPD